MAQVTKLLGLQTGWVWLLNEQGAPYLAAAQALPPYLADHPQRMTGFCLCLDTFLNGDLEGAANINVLRCSRLKNAERDSDPSSLGLRFHASVPIYAGDTPLGVLNVASEDWRELQVEELQLLHTLAQGMAAITLQLETADAYMGKRSSTEEGSRPKRAQEAIRRALSLARSNLEEARRSVMDLRAAPLQDRILPEALSALAQQAGDETPVEVQYTYSPPADFPALPARLEAAIYRIAQEALANACKHAEAQHIYLTLTVDDQHLHLQVQDDGRGFDPDKVTRSTGEGHFGLAGMSERVKLLGGSICIQSEPGAGTCIDVYVPL